MARSTLFSRFKIKSPSAWPLPSKSSLQSTRIDRSVEVAEQGKAVDMRPSDPISAGRRQLTVVSCSLAEAAALASRLDPEDLCNLIETYQRAIAEIATRFEGFVAKHSGDGVLIYFGHPDAREDDAERAIRCALTIADMVTRLRPDEELPTRIGVATRIGVVGDRTDGSGSREGSSVGEAPSLAARLQHAAAPNSVLIAESTRRLVGELFEYQAVEVKGIGGPVPAWEVLRPRVVSSRFEALRGSALTRLVGRDEEIDLLSRRWERAKGGDGQVVLISGEPGFDQGQTGGSCILTIPGRGYHFGAADTRVGVSGDFTAPADIRDSARPRLSIVVIPFINLGDDREQQYFADGITEDITTELSRSANMFVISRTTAFTYREKLVDTKQIGRELGVRYMLEGSVRGSGNQLRVNAQLIDAETDAHLWAERFDRHMGDLFSLQSEIASYIANALGVELIAVEAARPSEHPDALDYILRGRVASVKPLSRENYIETIGLFEHALALNPQSVEAQSYLATALAGRRMNAVTDTAADDLARAEDLAGHALAAAPRNPLVHFAKGQVLCAQHRSKEALFEYATALASNRNMVGALHGIGHCNLLAGSIEETIPLVSQAVRLSPRDPQIGDWYFEIGRAYLLQSRTDEAINWLEKARSAQPGVPAAHSHLAAAYAFKGKTEPAAAELAEARRLQGGDLFSSIGDLKAYFGEWLRVPKFRALWEATYLAGLRKAGMPEE